MKTLTPLSRIKLVLLAGTLASALSVAHGDINTSLTAGTSAWDTTPTFGTATPSTSKLAYVGANPLQQTISVDTTFTLEKIAFAVTVSSGFSANMTLSIYEVSDPLASTFTAETNLLPSGGSFSYSSESPLTGILTLDLTGIDQITLSADKFYVISLAKGTATSNPAFGYFSSGDNSESAYLGGALYYNRAFQDGTNGQDLAFAVYGTAIPEPSTVAFSIAGAAALLLVFRRRMRKNA